jgi:tape measure domain-containing protein
MIKFQADAGNSQVLSESLRQMDQLSRAKVNAKAELNAEAERTSKARADIKAELAEKLSASSFERSIRLGVEQERHATEMRDISLEREKNLQEIRTTAARQREEDKAKRIATAQINAMSLMSQQERHAVELRNIAIEREMNLQEIRTTAARQREEDKATFAAKRDEAKKAAKDIAKSLKESEGGGGSRGNQTLWDASRMLRGLSLFAGEGKIGTILRQFQGITAFASKANPYLTAGAIALKGVFSYVKWIISGFQQMWSAIKFVGSIILDLAEKFAKMAAAGVAAIGAVTSAFTVASVQAAIHRDSIMRGLASLSGGMKNAKAEFSSLQKIGLMPGITLDAALTGAQRLQAVGMQFSTVTRVLKEFANANALMGGNAENLDRATMMLEEMAGRGKVAGEQLRQIARDIPPFMRVLRDEFGTTSAEAIDAMSMSFDEFMQKTLAGFEKLPRATTGPENALVNLKDAWLNLKVAFGGPLLSGLTVAFNAIADALRSMAPYFSAIGTALANIIYPYIQKIKNFFDNLTFEKFRSGLIEFLYAASKMLDNLGNRMIVWWFTMQQTFMPLAKGTLSMLIGIADKYLAYVAVHWKSAVGVAFDLMKKVEHLSGALERDTRPKAERDADPAEVRRRDRHEIWRDYRYKDPKTRQWATEKAEALGLIDSLRDAGKGFMDSANKWLDDRSKDLLDRYIKALDNQGKFTRGLNQDIESLNNWLNRIKSGANAEDELTQSTTNLAGAELSEGEAAIKRVQAMQLLLQTVDPATGALYDFYEAHKLVHDAIKANTESLNQETQAMADLQKQAQSNFDQEEKRRKEDIEWANTHATQQDLDEAEYRARQTEVYYRTYSDAAGKGKGKDADISRIADAYKMEHDTWENRVRLITEALRKQDETAKDIARQNRQDAKEREKLERDQVHAYLKDLRDRSGKDTRSQRSLDEGLTAMVVGNLGASGQDILAQGRMQANDGERLKASVLGSMKSLADVVVDAFREGTAEVTRIVKEESYKRRSTYEQAAYS